MSAFRNALRRSLLPSKRHTAIFCYNSPPWIWQPQQIRQRLNHLRRIQSSGASARYANMTFDTNIAGNARAPASASMTSSAKLAGNAKAPDSASMTSNANGARSVAVPATASTERDAPDARSVAVPAYASTASSTTGAPSVRTSLAPWKAAHNSVTVSAQPECCCTTCAPSTAASPRR